MRPHPLLIIGLEQLIQRALFTISRGRTSIIIAHRLSTIRNCDNILLIKNGKIVEQGNHGTLIEKRTAIIQRYGLFKLVKVSYSLFHPKTNK